MKKHVILFEALIDEAREEFFESDIETGKEIVERYADAINMSINEKEIDFVFNHYKKYITKKKDLNSSNDYFFDYRLPLSDFYEY